MSKEIRTLEVMPEDVKVLYTQVLASQAITDNRMDPKEFSDLYLFMSQIGLSSVSRSEVRQFLISTHPNKISEVVDTLINKVKPEEVDAIKFSVVKDLLRVARVDNLVSPEETSNIQAIATQLYGDSQDVKVIRLAEDAIEYDEKLLKGTLTPGEFEKISKDLAAKAGAIGIPIMAVYFSGSVVGLSAAGITSGLATLGVGGLLGLSSMVTGIGVVVVLGVVTYQTTRWLISGKEREMKAKREYMIQQVIQLNQRANIALAEDLNELAAKMEHLASMSEQNRKMLERLRALYESALNALKEREQQYAAS